MSLYALESLHLNTLRHRGETCSVDAFWLCRVSRPVSAIARCFSPHSIVENHPRSVTLDLLIPSWGKINWLLDAFGYTCAIVCAAACFL